MAKRNLSEIRARIKKEKEDKQNKGGNNLNPDIFPFWNMNDEDDTAVVRFLPDANDDNEMFYVELFEHNLTVGDKNRKVTCPTTFGEECPICELSQRWYKEGDSDQGKVYYKKLVRLARALVVKDPLPENDDTGETYEGKVVTLRLSYQVMDRILEGLSIDFDEDDEALPWELKDGTNFNIRKRSNGKFPDYKLASQFAKRPSDVSDDIDEDEDIIDLTTLLPDNPGVEKVQALLDAHINGEDLEEDDDDGEEKEEKSKPKKSKKDKKKKDKKDKKKKSKKVVEEDDDEDDTPPFDTEDDDDEDDSSSSQDDDDEDDDEDLDELMAQIKKKKNKKSK